MKTLCSLLVFCCSVLLFSQERTTYLSVSFHDEAIPSVITILEKQTGYRFFYVEDWLESTTISGDYVDVSLDALLTDIFKDTDIQFHIAANQKIYLIRNQIIYDRLPKGFFGNELDSLNVIKERTSINEAVPIFLNTEKVNRATPIKTVRIGKVNPESSRGKFLLKGTVISSSTGEPIQDLAILIKEGSIGAVTDAAGYYELELSYGRNTLRTKSLGFSDTELQVVIYNDGIFDFSLDDSLEQLEEVIVLGSARKNVEDATTGANQIIAEETKNIPLILGERDVLKVATTLPGISTAGEGAAGFNVRGGNTDQNLILLDGAVIYNPSHFFGIFQALNPYAVEDVTIYKGNIPARFGGRLASVFEISTKDGNTSKFAGEASIGPVTSNIVLETPIVKDKASLLVGGRGTYSDWILQSLDDESLNNSQASFYDVIAKYTHKLNDNNSIRATAYYSKDNFSITSDSLFGFGNRMISIGLNHKFNEKNKAELTLANSEYNFEIEYDGDANRDFDLGYTINETELKLNFVKLLNERHTLEYGVSSKLYLVNPGNRNPLNEESIIEPIDIPREKGLESALFISDKFKMSDRLLIDAGVRFSVFSALGPSIQRVYQENLPRNEANLIDTREFERNEFITTYRRARVQVVCQVSPYIRSIDQGQC